MVLERSARTLAGNPASSIAQILGDDPREMCDAARRFLIVILDDKFIAIEVKKKEENSEHQKKFEQHPQRRHVVLTRNIDDIQPAAGAQTKLQQLFSA